MEAVRLATVPPPGLDRPTQLRAAREVLRIEAIGLWKVSATLGDSFSDAVELMLACTGSVLVTGMGKAGLVGQKLAATLASTGTRSHFVHPAEAFHGDLGRFSSDDVVLMLTQSGETSEVVQLLPSLKSMHVPLVAITANRTSTVGRAAQLVIELGHLEEACSLGLAPSTSTTAMLAVGDALALVLSQMRGFQPEDFARFHPGGSLGLKLSKVQDHMRPLAECRLASENELVREVIVQCRRPGRRTGAVMLLGDDGKLTGLFTDSDLAKLIEQRQEQAFDRPIREVMTIHCACLPIDTPTEEALQLLAQRKISELPIVDSQNRPVGMLDVTDLVQVSGSKTSPAPPIPAMRVFTGRETSEQDQCG